MKKIFVCSWLLCLLLTGGLYGQSPADFDTYKAKYPDMIGVMLKHHEQVDLRLDGDSILVEERDYREILHLRENARLLGEDQVYSSLFRQKKNLEAYTLVPEKKKFRKVAVEQFTEKDEQSSGVFFDDTRVTFFQYPSVQAGAITVKDYTTTITDPRFLTSFYFSSFIPTEEATLEIVADKEIHINYLAQNTEGFEIDFSQEEKGDRVIYRWTARSLEKMDTENDAPKISYFAPHIIYFIDHVEINGTDRKILSNVDDLYQMYMGFIENLNAEEDPELRAIVDSLVSDADSETEKVKKIFYWVQNNIQYIAFEDGMRGFIPHHASLVYEKRYGDCKDMASITKHMIDLAGIGNAYLTWIGSRDIPYKYTDVPTPAVDNHMITTWEKDGEYYYLDATSKYTRFGLPSSMIQGKQALIAVDENTFVLGEVPIIDATQNIMADSVTLRLSEGKLTGEGKALLSGYPQVFRTYSFTGTDKREEQRKIRNFVTKGSNKFILEDYSISNLGDRDQPLTIDYHYSLEDYMQQVGDEIYLNLNLERPYDNAQIDIEKREVPKENDYHYTISNFTSFEIPEGYAIDFMPEGFSGSNSFFSYTIDYKVEEGKVLVSTQIQVTYLLLQKEEFEAWNETIDSLSDAYREVIILKKKDS